MAHSLSARKRVRQSIARNGRNRARKQVIKAVVKDFLAKVQSGDSAAGSAALSAAASKLDRAAAKGTLHPKTAARKKSRLAKKLKAVKKA